MNYTLSNIADIVKGELTGNGDSVITCICTDTRRMQNPKDALFVAIAGKHNSGHKYIEQAYKHGVRCFLLNNAPDVKIAAKSLASAPQTTSIIYVEDTFAAIQTLAAHHRAQHTCPVVGITGSNGKTIVKEWVAQLLLPQIRLHRSPRSYNSQLGVPLSLLQLNEQAQCSIIEAGISRYGEMERLAKMIKPNIVIVTNIGSAHDEGFDSFYTKKNEKLKLAAPAQIVICSKHDIDFYASVNYNGSTYDKTLAAWEYVRDPQTHKAQCKITATYGCSTIPGLDKEYAYTSPFYSGYKRPALLMSDDIIDIDVDIPFTDPVSIENAMNALVLCYVLSKRYPDLNINIPSIVKSLPMLTPITMRMEQRQGVNGCVIVNDALCADFSTLNIALDTLTQCAQGKALTVILSAVDIVPSKVNPMPIMGYYARFPRRNFDKEINDMFCQHNVSKLVLIDIGKVHLYGNYNPRIYYYSSVDEFLQRHDLMSFKDEAILIKGSRSYGMERIAQRLEQHTHITTLDVNLTAMAYNLTAIRNVIAHTIKVRTKKKVIKPARPKIMALIKANAYGAGLCEVGRFLEQRGVDYLGVAFADEGVALRQAGIALPIIALNPEYETFDQMVEHRIEPEIYSISVLRRFAYAVRRAGEWDYPIHIKLDTGMHRLGFLPEQTEALLSALQETHGILRTASIFSHLAAADEPQYDYFTQKQYRLFSRWSSEIVEALTKDQKPEDKGQKILRHLANSFGTLCFPQMQMDMVRVGAALYGIIRSQAAENPLRSVCTLRSAIVQIKVIPKGGTVGYGCRFKAKRDTVVGIVPVGYADGLDRRLGNGAGKAMVNGVPAPIVGNICMDICMINLMGTYAQEGDEVVFFGDNPSIENVAAQLGTISYEILTGIAPRVKRVYYYE